MMLGWSDASFPACPFILDHGPHRPHCDDCCLVVAWGPSAAVLELPDWPARPTASAGAAPGERRATASGQSTSVRFAVMGEGLNPLTSIQVPTDSSHAAIGSVASMLMPEVCSL